ncbi:MAG: DUF4956 domain-containing protein [Flavobacteriales bacterium]
MFTPVTCNSMFEDNFIFGIKLLDTLSLKETVLKYIFNLVPALFVCWFLYYKNHKKKEYFFTLMMFNTLIFFVCLLLNSVKIKMGFAFGLFALFGLLRYRSGSLPLKEMTYLFALIVIAVVNALMNERISLTEIGFFNLVMIVLTYILEKFTYEPELKIKIMQIADVEIVKFENHEELKKRIQEITGIYPYKVEVGEIDLIKHKSEVKFWYEDKSGS